MGDCSRQASLSKFFSALFSDHFVSPVTDNLLFFNKWKRGKTRKNVWHASVAFCLLADEGGMLLTQLQCPMGCH